MRTIEDPANSVGELVSAQQSVGLDHLPLAVHPLGLDGVQPRALLGQKAAHDPHDAFAALSDLAVVGAEPTPDFFGDVPACVVPDQEQDLLADLFELFATPLEESGRYPTDGPTIHEPQPRPIELRQVESVAGDGFTAGCGVAEPSCIMRA